MLFQPTPVLQCDHLQAQRLLNACRQGGVWGHLSALQRWNVMHRRQAGYSPQPEAFRINHFHNKETE